MSFFHSFINIRVTKEIEELRISTFRKWIYSLVNSKEESKTLRLGQRE